ncbi:MAG: SixA phosphatase family protein [Anaerolineae bacterium]
MKLYFIRHGKAGYDAPTGEARPLTDVGVQQAIDNGALLKALNVQASAIYTSPRLRARQTAEYIGEALTCEPEITDDCNFDFSAKKALALAARHAPDAELLFVGHNPSMSAVVTQLTGAQVELPTCAIACVTRVHPGDLHAAILKWMVTPKLIAGLITLNTLNN